jgi:hypothetical protein
MLLRELLPERTPHFAIVFLSLIAAFTAREVNL